MERITRQAISYRLSSHHHQRRPRHNMGIRDVLRIPKPHHRTRSETRDEDTLETIEGPTDVGLTAPRFTESAPDLVADPSLPQTSSPSTPPIQEPKGTRKIFIPNGLPTSIFVRHRPFRLQSISISFQQEAKEAAGTPWSRR